MDPPFSAVRCRCANAIIVPHVAVYLCMLKACGPLSGKRRLKRGSILSQLTSVTGHSHLSTHPQYSCWNRQSVIQCDSLMFLTGPGFYLVTLKVDVKYIFRLSWQDSSEVKTCILLYIKNIKNIVVDNGGPCFFVTRDNPVIQFIYLK